MIYRLFLKEKNSNILTIVEGYDESIKYMEEHPDAIPIYEELKDISDWHRKIR